MAYCIEHSNLTCLVLTLFFISWGIHNLVFPKTQGSKIPCLLLLLDDCGGAVFFFSTMGGFDPEAPASVSTASFVLGLPSSSDFAFPDISILPLEKILCSRGLKQKNKKWSLITTDGRYRSQFQSLQVFAAAIAMLVVITYANALAFCWFFFIFYWKSHITYLKAKLLLIIFKLHTVTLRQSIFLIQSVVYSNRWRWSSVHDYLQQK